MLEELAKIKEKCIKCEKCQLCNSRTNIVFSDGTPNPKLMLIGEAPGFYEDQQGKPFVGKAGQLLDRIFASVGLSRQKDIYICNTLKCRPPENRNPLPEEKEACWEYLKAQIDIIKPKIIKNIFSSLTRIPPRSYYFDSKEVCLYYIVYHTSTFFAISKRRIFCDHFPFFVCYTSSVKRR